MTNGGSVKVKNRAQEDRLTRPGRPVGRSALAAACVAMLVAYLPFSAVNGSLGTIGQATQASTVGLQWASDAFAAALASVVLAAGALGDRYGRRRVATVGLVLTAVGSTVSATAGLVPAPACLPVLWGGQVIAGVGAGLVMSATLALISATAPDQAGRTRGIALWASALVLGLGGGPFVAGAVSSVAGWSWMFVPIAVAAAATAGWLEAASPESSAPGHREVDWSGITLGILAVGFVVFGIIEVGTVGVAPLVVGIVLLGAFLLVEHRAAAPMLDLSLFRSPPFTAAGIAAASVLFTVVGMVFVLSLFFEVAQGVSPLSVAVRLGFLFAFNAIAGPIAAAAQRRVTARVPLLVGLVIAATGTFTLAGVTPNSPLLDAGLRLSLLGFGAGLVMSTASAVAVQSGPGSKAAMAGAANNALRQLGATLGPALLGATVAAHAHTAAGLTAAAHASALTTAIVLLTAAAIGAALLARRAPTASL